MRRAGASEDPWPPERRSSARLVVERYSSPPARPLRHSPPSEASVHASFAYAELIMGDDCRYFLEPSVRADMVTGTPPRTHPSRRKQVVPTRIPLAAKEAKTQRVPFEALFAARDALFGSIPVAQVEEVVRHTT